MMDTAHGENTRACSRTAVDVPVTLFFGRGSHLYGRLIDISFGGAFVETDTTVLAVDTPLTVILKGRTGTQEPLYKMSAVVVHKNPDGAGVMFDELDEETVRSLRRVYHDALG